MKYYLLAVSPSEDSFVIGLMPRTKTECRQAITWMTIGGFDMTYRITTYEPDKECFVDLHGAIYRPEQGPYTAAAWQEFQLSLRK